MSVPRFFFTTPNSAVLVSALTHMLLRDANAALGQRYVLAKNEAEKLSANFDEKNPAHGAFWTWFDAGIKSGEIIQMGTHLFVVASQIVQISYEDRYVSYRICGEPSDRSHDAGDFGGAKAKREAAGLMTTQAIFKHVTEQV
jgi:hypothetical protein